MWQRFKNYLFTSPLHDSVKSSNLNKVRLLLDNGANINQKDYFGSTAFHYAIRTNNLSMIQFLHAKGADLNAQSPSTEFRARFQRAITISNQALRFLALSICTYYTTLSGATFMLWWFPELNTLKFTIVSALNLTSHFYINCMCMAAFLSLKAGFNRIPNQWKRHYRDAFILGLFVELILPSSLSLIGTILMFPAALGFGISLSGTLGELFTFFHRAIINFIADTSARLISSVINFCLRQADNWGGTPLHVAARLNQIENIHYLIKNSADIARQDLNNQTALEVAFSAGHYGIVEQLKNAGLPPQNRDKIKRVMNHFYKTEAAGLCLLPKVAKVIKDLNSKIESTEENKQESAILDKIHDKQPELVFFAKIYHACPDVGRKIMSHTGKFGDTEEQSLARIRRIMSTYS